MKKWPLYAVKESGDCFKAWFVRDIARSDTCIMHKTQIRKIKDIQFNFFVYFCFVLELWHNVSCIFNDVGEILCSIKPTVLLQHKLV